MHTQNAKFITLEGIEGVGKSTSLGYIKQFLQSQDIDFIQTREPGGTEIAEAIRRVLLDHHDETMCKDTELLLAFAGRAQHLQSIIYPALKAKKWVVCDRFSDATFAYQGGGRGIPLQRIDEIKQWVHGDFKPDLTLFLQAPVNIALERAKGRGKLDRIEIEKEQFFERVQNTYLELAAAEPNRFKVIDATQTPAQVEIEINRYLEEFLKHA